MSLQLPNTNVYLSLEMTKIATTKPQSINLRSLNYSPILNPLIESSEITIRRRSVRTGRGSDLVDARTGEIVAASVIVTSEEKDDAEFVKVFAEGVRAAFLLNRTAYRVFQAVLDVYQKTSMSRGYAESVELFFFDGGISGVDAGMSEKTFQRGLKDLMQKKFLHPRSPGSYWVNPQLFFKGDRVAFVREYRRKRATSPPAVLELRDEESLDS